MSSSTNARCPTPTPASHDIIAVLWDDLVLTNPPLTQAGGYVESFSPCPYPEATAGNCVIFQWNNAAFFSNINTTLTFQVVLCDNGNILMKYLAADPQAGATSTTGIENAGSTDGLTHTCHTPGSIPPNFAILFKYPLLGDLNADGRIDGLDIQPFVNCLLAPSAPCPAADMNADAIVDVNDVPLFVAAVLAQNAFPAPVPTNTAIFQDGILTITGDDQDNTLIAGRDPAGRILINDGAIPITGGVATVTNTALIRILGLAGNDDLELSEVNGPMPAAELFGGDGNDRLVGGSQSDVLHGGPGNDTLLGKGGDDQLFGDDGDDTLNGGTGNDLVHGGAGNDTLIWNPGDQNDVLEGDAGQDTLVFNSSNGSESIDLSANGPRLRIFRNIAAITLDCAGIEQVTINPVGGLDQITVNDLSGTEVTNVSIDLATPPGSSQGDGSPDTVFVNGTNNADHIIVTGSSAAVQITGLAASVTILGAEPARDRLTINGLGGDDIIDASAVQAGAIPLTLNGGSGADQLIGGAGDDTLIGGQGADLMHGGPGNDTFIWNPGDQNDIIEGDAGNDTLLFNGANVSEVVDLSANGPRLRLTRNVASITLDCDGIEQVVFNASGGADQITVNDLTGTTVTSVTLDLSATAGSGTGDGQPDSVIVNATTFDDIINITGNAAATTVSGLAAQVTILGAESTLDRLFINALAGDDTVQAAGVHAGAIALTIDGGDDDDVLIGGDNNDTLLGGIGDDVLIGGPGQDTLDGGPGNNILIQ